MSILKKITTKIQQVPAKAFQEIYEQHVNDASFLWGLRENALNQPHYEIEDIHDLEKRIDSHIDGLMTALDISWEICLEALKLNHPGDVFVVSIVAFRSRDIEKIKLAVSAGLESPELTQGLVSAMAWLSENLIEDWMFKFLNSKDLNHKFLSISVHSARRQHPGEMLTGLLKRNDCLSHKPLRARMLRLIGELKLFDLRWALDEAYQDEDQEVKFWVNWSTLMLGDKTAAPQLQDYLRQAGKLQHVSLNTAFRALPIEQGRAWISQLASEQGFKRLVISATGILGDPQAVPWLIEKMRHVDTAKLAGESFTMITGIDLEKYDLAIEGPEDISIIPNDDPDDPNVDMDPDENLPFPDVDKVALTWQKFGAKYKVGVRYFLGQEIEEPMLQKILSCGSQRHRIAAAYELALINNQVELANVRARIKQ